MTRRNSQLARTNDTHARHIQQHGFKSQQPALPPMPTKDGICRWCEKAFNEYGTCPGGCMANDDPCLAGHCPECNRTFRTGRAGAVTCFECDARERRQYASVKPLGTFKTYKTLREDQ